MPHLEADKQEASTGTEEEHARHLAQFVAAAADAGFEATVEDSGLTVDLARRGPAGDVVGAMRFQVLEIAGKAVWMVECPARRPSQDGGMWRAPFREVGEHIGPKSFGWLAYWWRHIPEAGMGWSYRCPEWLRAATGGQRPVRPTLG